LQALLLLQDLTGLPFNLSFASEEFSIGSSSLYQAYYSSEKPTHWEQNHGQKASIESQQKYNIIYQLSKIKNANHDYEQAEYRKLYCS
jgi:hypothetical protein